MPNTLNVKENDEIIADRMNAWAFNNILGYGGNYGKQNEGYNAYSFLRRGTEIQNNIKPTMIGIPLSMSTAEQQTEMSRQFGNGRTNGDEQSLYGATLQVPGGKNPMELDDNGFFEQMKGTPQNVSSNLSQYKLGTGVFDQSATQAMGGSNAKYGGIGRDVMQNTTGTGFTADIAERESFAKMPLPSYLGYGVKDNVELIEYVSEKYKDEIDIAWNMAEDMAPTIAIELAKKGATFLPPHLKAGALGLLALLDICLAVKDVYDEWDDDVDEYAQAHKCSREVAEKNVKPLKNILDGTMVFFTQEWVKYALETAEIHADSKVAIIAAVLALIPEQSLKEWGRTITEWNRENQAW